MKGSSSVVPEEATMAEVQLQLPEVEVDKAAALAHLTWEHLTVVVPARIGSRKILDDCSGCVAPGQLLAIMGPSGCGKSTLLNILAGRFPASTGQGEIRLNGRNSSLSYGTVAYVTQTDHLTGTLTVWETLMCVANLRLPSSIKAPWKRLLVEATIRDMGLTDAMHTYVGNWHLTGLSGGQLRRLSLACELLTQPKLLFLDEPTSGLDAAAAFHVVSIHQPSSEVFQQFNYLCLLAGGRTVYFGHTSAAAAHFAGAGLPVPDLTNMSDHFLRCINKDFLADAQVNVDRLVTAYQGSEQHSQVQSIISEWNQGALPRYHRDQEGSGWLRQTLALTHRNILNGARDLGVFWVRLVMYAMLCLCLGFVFFQLDNSWKAVYSRASLLFFVVAFLSFMGIAAMPAFVEDMQVFTRERLNGYYGIGSFALANTLSSLPFIFAITVISTLCVYYLASLNDDSDRVIYFILDLFISLLVTESLFMAVTPILPHFLAGIAAGAGIMGLFMIVCGFFQLTSQLPKPILRIPLHYISFHTYAFFGFMHNEFDGVDQWQCPCSVQFEGCNAPCSFSSQEVLRFYDVHGLSKWLDLVILAGMMLFYRMFFMATLHMREFMSRCHFRLF